MVPLRRVGLDLGSGGALTTEELRYIHREIIETVKPALRAREIFAIERVPSVGFREIRKYTETDMGPALIDMEGESVNLDRTELSEGDIKLPVIHKEFIINWRDVEARREIGQSLPLQDAKNAARQVSEEENRLCLSGEYTGWRALGIEGLMTATNRNTQASAGAWPANAITDINAAIGNLETSGFNQGPYYLVTRVSWIRKLMAQVTNTEITYLQFLLANDIIQGVVADDDVYASDGGTDGGAVCVPGAENFALQVARDVTTRFREMLNMNQFGQVYEVVTPMIKRPTSICEITGLT